MASTIITKYSGTASAVPVTGDLTQGELAVNVTDKRLFTKNSGGTVVELGTNPASLALPNGTANGVAYLNGSKVVTTGSALTFDGTNFATTGTVSGTNHIVTGGSASGNSMYLATTNSIGWSTNGTERMRVDASGNVGVGVTPSAWGSSFKALELPAGSSLITNSSDYVGLISNAYNNGTSWLYKSTAPAGRYLVSQNSHQWYSAASGTAGNAITFTQAMTLDASGNLGIGTSSPGYKLDVQGTVASTNVARIKPLAGSSGSTITLDIQSGSGSSVAAFYNAPVGSFVLDGSGNLGLGVTPSAWQAGRTALQFGAIAFLRGDSGVSEIGANAYFNGTNWIYTTTGAASRFTQSAGAFSLHTAPSGTAGNAITFTQAMTLDASGNLLVGTTSQVNSEKANVTQSSGLSTFVANNTNASFVNVNIESRTTSTTTNGSFYHFRGISNGTNRFIVLDSGNVQNTNNSYGAISDIKLKENIVDATPKLENLMQVRVVNYNLKSDPEHKQIGVVAQEVEQVFPGIVEELSDRDVDGNDLGTTTKSVKYSVFVPMLIKAIQEQQAIINQLTERITILEGK